MKNLKKLSAAFMLAALLSSGLTSCIDNEVSPLVESIYASQAELLAAQAAVQNAEATLRLAQAAAQDALTAKTEAITADFIATSAQDLIAQIAATELAVEEARLGMLLAQAEFDQDMAQILAAIRTASNTEAGIHAADYATAMGKIATLKGEKLTIQQSIATKSLYMKSITAGAEMTWETYLAGLESDVLAKEASVIANEAFIVRANAYLDGDYADMVDALAVAEDAQTAKQAEIAALVAERGMVDDAATTTVNEASGILGDIDTEYTKFKTAYTTLVGELNGYISTKEGLEDDIETLTTVTIPGLEATIADYAATTTTLELAVATAEARIGAVEGTNHASNHAPGTGLLGDIETKVGEIAAKTTEIGTLTTAVGVYGTAPAAGNPARVATPTVALTPQDLLWNANLALLDHNAAFAALTATYNAAATALEAAQTAFDGASYAADLQTAKDDRDAEIITRQAAIDAYDAAALAFSGSTTGSVTTDGSGNHSASFPPFNAPTNLDFDLGEVGIHTDAAPDTYMQVATWKETSIGSNVYIPATFAATKYNTADLAVAVQAIKDDVTNNTITLDNQVYLWNDNAAPASAMLLTDFSGATVNPDIHALSAADAAAASLAVPSLVVFVNVELDDASVTNLYTFNTTTNMLGSDDFTTRPFYTSGDGTVAVPYVFNTVLTASSTNAGYDSTPNADGEPNGSIDTLTAQAELWNDELEVFKKQNAFDLGDDALVAAQATFDAQELLFDMGLATRATLEGDVTTAAAAVTAANALVTAANGEKSDLMDEKAELEAELGTADYAARATNSVNLPLSWDVHANDGLAAGDEIFDYLASAGWDSDATAGADSLTAYAELWNAENALAIHTATDLAGYNTQLATANGDVASKTLLIAENAILIARWQADVDALTAEYDALMLTPLYAALQVRVLEIADELAVLGAEKAVLDAEVGALVLTVSFEGIASMTALETAITDAQAIIDGAPAALDILAAKIALGEVSVANLVAEIASLTEELADKDALIALRVVEAEGYLALLNAALGN